MRAGRANNAAEYLDYRYKVSQGGFLTDVEVSREELRIVLDRLALLEEQVKDVPIYRGDTVQELEDDEPTGVVLSVETIRDTVVYEVKLFKQYANLKTLKYYREEIELVKRAE